MKKEARGFPDNPKIVAEKIRDIIDIMVGRMSLESQQRAYPNLRSKFQRFPVGEMAAKRAPGGASIGVSMGLVKNILNGRDPIFIRTVLNELIKVL
jgi:hypothetical protein